VNLHKLVNIHKLVNMHKTAAGILAALLLLAPAATPAQAAGKTITTQWYLASTGLSALKASGHDGTGVKIAVVDGAAPDTSVPELQGANIKSSAYPCNYTPSADSIAHATLVASILASPKYGWAPKAQYTFYPTQTEDDRKISGACATSAIADAINRALNDQPDLISVQMGAFGYAPDSVWAVVRAALKSTPIIMGAGNGTRRITDDASINTVVAVGATDQQGKHAAFSNTGISLTISAPGTNINGRNPDASGKLTRITTDNKGTSLSTPMVTGALTLAKQSWPKATGNQLIRSMLYTATNTTGNHDDELGWGTLNAQKLVATNPSDQEDSQPLGEKNPDGRGSAQDFTNYQNGLVDPIEISESDTDYVYRGTDTSLCRAAVRCELGTAPTTTPTTKNDNTNTTKTTSTNPVWPIAIGIGATTALATAITTITITRRRKTNKHSTPNPPNPNPPNPPYNPNYPPPNWPPTNQPPN
jgi:hypothetical protein